MAKTEDRDALVGRVADVLRRSGVPDADRLISLLERNLPKRLFEVAADDHVTAHGRSSGHRAEIDGSGVCGCFYCLARFAPAEITEWVDTDTTALCPRCGIDSVIGSASGYPITAEFLARMRAHWF
jgi:hypothetical protein